MRHLPFRLSALARLAPLACIAGPVSLGLAAPYSPAPRIQLDGSEGRELQLLQSNAELSVVSAGDVSVALADRGSNPWTIRMSDGRGIVWSAAQNVRPPGSPGTIREATACIVGDQVVVQWIDTRFDPVGLSAGGAFIRIFDANSLIGGPEIQIPTGSIPAQTSLIFSSFACTTVGDEVHMHLAIRRNVDTPVPDTETDAVVLTSSRDGGSTWSAPQVLEQSQLTVPISLATRPQVLADGSEVHLLWSRSNQGVKVPDFILYQRSSDAGLSLDFPMPQPIVVLAGLFDYQATLRGDILGVGYVFASQPFGIPQGRGVLSTNGGDSFDVDVFPDSPFGVSSSDAPRIQGGPGPLDAIVAFGVVDGFGEEQVLIQRMENGSFGPNSTLVLPHPPGSAAFQPRVATSDEDRDRVLVTWAQVDQGVSSTLASFSYDGGATFGTPRTVASVSSSNDGLAWNELYQNAIVALGDSGDAWVGGLRAQYIAPTGWTSGSTLLGADFVRFGGGADLAYLLGSTAQDGFPLPLGDGRELGIGASPLFNALLPAALSGPLAAVLDPDGTGATPGLALAAPGVPPGLAVELVGLSLDLDTLSFVDISDRLSVSVP